jgi:hypothetical protein
MSSAQTAAATEATKQYAADRAIDDPVKLERAARIVRTALERKRLKLADIAPGAVEPTEPAVTPVRRPARGAVRRPDRGTVARPADSQRRAA